MQWLFWLDYLGSFGKPTWILLACKNDCMCYVGSSGKSSLQHLYVWKTPTEYYSYYEKIGNMNHLEKFQRAHLLNMSIFCSVILSGPELINAKSWSSYDHQFLPNSGLCEEIPSTAMQPGGFFRLPKWWWFWSTSWCVHGNCCIWCRCSWYM